VLSFVGHSLASEQAPDDREALLELRHANTGFGRLSEAGEVPGDAEADAEQRPAPRQVLQRRRLQRDPPRPAARECGDHGAEPDCPSLACHRAQHHPRIGYRQVGDQVVREEEAVHPASSARRARSQRMSGRPNVPKFGRYSAIRTEGESMGSPVLSPLALSRFF